MSKQRVHPLVERVLRIEEELEQIKKKMYETHGDDLEDRVDDLEAKHEEKYSVTKALVELDEARANRNAQNSQFSNPSGTQVGASTAAGVPGSIDTSAETTLVITGQKATGSETLTLASYLVELHYRA